MIEEIKWQSSALPLTNLRFRLSYANYFQSNTGPDLTEPHIHSGIEFYINLMGDVSFLVDNHLHPVQSGDIIISLPNIVHHCIYHNPTKHEHFCLWLDVPNDSPLLQFTKSKSFVPRFTFSEENRNLALNFLSNLRDLGEDENPTNQILKTSYLLQFLSLFITGTNLAKDSHTIPPTFQNILKYFDEHASTIHSLQEVADAFFISLATLNRYFKKYVQITPKEFLESKKLSMAKIILSNGGSVTTAGDEAGFFDTSHFIAAFKKKFGETPLQYKRSISKIK